MTHSLHRHGFIKPDHSFWQILIACSGADLMKKGEPFLLNCEAFSPSLRVVFAIVDQHPQASLYLQQICRNLYSTTVYELEFSAGYTPLSSSAAMYEAAYWLFRHTEHALLLMDIDHSVLGDLTLLPVALSRSDIAGQTIQGKTLITEALPLWVRHTPGTTSFLKTLKHHSHISASQKTGANDALNAAILNTGQSLKIEHLPDIFCDKTLKEETRILNNSNWYSQGSTEQHSRFQLQLENIKKPPGSFVLLPLQDIGTKTPLEDNSFAARTSRLSRPGRIAWRVMAHLIQQTSHAAGIPTRILPVAQWEVTRELIEKLPPADQIFIPHKNSKQLPLKNAIYYMQEYLPELFTCSPTGWGASASWSNSGHFINTPIHSGLQDFKHQFQAQRKTKAPQKRGRSGSLPQFDALAVLQVPEDDALTQHANCSLESFVEDLANLARTENIRILFRKHPLDRTDFYRIMKKRWASKHALFSSTGHIHDIIAKAKCIFTINSGVGFESILLGKPVVSYGKSAYEKAVVTASTATLATAYKHAVCEPDHARTQRYDHFLSWFLFQIGFKLDEPHLNLAVSSREPPDFKKNPLLNFLKQEKHLAALPAQAKMSSEPYSFNVISSPLIKAVSGPVRKLKKKAGRSIYIPAINTAKSFLVSRFDTAFFKGKSVCLIGDPDQLQGSETGHFIDTHDIVIRMNAGNPFLLRKGVTLEPQHQKYILKTATQSDRNSKSARILIDPSAPDHILKRYTAISETGSKTHIWPLPSKNAHHSLPSVSLLSAQFIVAEPDLHRLSASFLKTHKVKSFSGTYTRSLQSKLAAPPSMILVWLELLRQSKLSSLSLLGCNFNTYPHTTEPEAGFAQPSANPQCNQEKELNYITNCILPTHDNIHLR